VNGHALLAKNSDREPNEAQLLTVVPHKTHGEPSLRTTYIEVDQVRQTNAVLLCRPFWMWGAEMGINEHGVAIGNEAVFTRGGYGATGLTGMDLLRLALERCDNAGSAVEMIIALLEQHGQGGNCGFTKRFFYNNSFLVADRHNRCLDPGDSRKAMGPQEGQGNRGDLQPPDHRPRLGRTVVRR
jgi:dipeptidase